MMWLRLLLMIPFLTLLMGCEPASLTVMEPLRRGVGLDVGPWVTLISVEPFRVCISWLTASDSVQSMMTYILDEGPETIITSEDDGCLHRVCMDLPAGARLRFRPAHTTPSMEKDAFFTLVTPSAGKPMKLVVLGDIQPRDESTEASASLVLDAVRREEPDWVIQVGDALQDGSEAVSWRHLLAVLPRLGAEIPLALVPGNHDIRHDDGASWTLGFAQPVAPDVDRRHRILDAGQARFFLLDAFYGALTPRDFAWLEARLEEALSAGLWRFVFFHGSILSSGMENMDLDLQEQLIPLFDRMRVHAVFYGHDHMYEHHELTYGPWLFSPDHLPAGHRVHYFLTGGGGARLEHEYGLMTRPETSYSRTLHDAQTGLERDFRFSRRHWNDDQVNELADPAWSRGGLAWFHDCSVECYQDDSLFWGQRYGENVLHYLTLEIDGDRAVVSARYPDGSIMSGPDGTDDQVFVIERETYNAVQFR